MDLNDYSNSYVVTAHKPLQGSRIPGPIQRSSFEQATSEVSKKLEMLNTNAAKPFPQRIGVVKAKMVTFYKNGEPFHTGTKVSIQPGKHFRTLENLRDYLTERTQIPYGVRYIFTLDGKRVHELEDLEDGQAYVISGTKTFQPFPYGQADKQRTNFNRINGPLRQDDIRLLRPLTPSVKKHIPQAIKDKPLAGESNSSLSLPNSREGRIITIVNNRDHSVRTKVLLNTRSPKPFEVVLLDLGQVINVKGAKRMFTAKGKEVRSFSQLKNDFRDVDTFYLDSGESPRRPDGKEWKSSHSMEALGSHGFVSRVPKMQRSDSAPNFADIWENQEHSTIPPIRTGQNRTDSVETANSRGRVSQELEALRTESREIGIADSVDRHRRRIESQMSRSSSKMRSMTEMEVMENRGHYQEPGERDLMDSAAIAADMTLERLAMNSRAGWESRYGSGLTERSGLYDRMNQTNRSRMQMSRETSEDRVNNLANRVASVRSERMAPVMSESRSETRGTERQVVNRDEMMDNREMERMNGARGMEQMSNNNRETERMSGGRGIEQMNNNNREIERMSDGRGMEQINSNNREIERMSDGRGMEQMNSNNREIERMSSGRGMERMNSSNRGNKAQERLETMSNRMDTREGGSMTTTRNVTSENKVDNPSEDRNNRNTTNTQREINSNSPKDFEELPMTADPNARMPNNSANNVRVLNESRNSAENENDLPTKALELDWIHGYNGQQFGRNLYIISSGELLYNVAAVAVLYDKHRKQQRHYMGHTEDIQCITVHPLKDIVASSQNAGRLPDSEAQIRIWKTDDLSTLVVLEHREILSHIYCLAFSFQDLLMVLNSGEDQELSMWDWQSRTTTGRATMPQELLSGGVFHPQMEEVLVTYGRQHFSFWQQQQEGYLERKDVIPTGLEDKHVTCLEFLPNNMIVTGDTKGFITLWTPNSFNGLEVLVLAKKLKAHESTIASLLLFPSGTLLSGDEDGHIYAWDITNKFAPVAVATLPMGSGGVRTLCPQEAKNPPDGHIFVGTTRNMIWEGTVQRKFRILQQGHFKGARALTVSPHQPEFFTGGLDNCFNKWGITTPFWKVLLESECLATSINPRGDIVSVGCANGKIVLFNAHTGDHMDTLQVTKAPINVLSYSPDGSKLAAGSHDGTLYFFDISEEGMHNVGPTIKGSNPILSLDWTKNSKYIQAAVNDNEYQELLLWEVESQKQAEEKNGLDWQERTCSAGEDIHGMWDNDYLKDVINVTCHRSISEKLLAAGDEDGFIRLFRYPCTSTKAAFFEYKQGSGSIAEVRFMARDKHLVSISSPDGSIFIWNVVPAPRS